MTPHTPSLTRPGIVAALAAAGCVYPEEEADLLLAEAATSDHLATMVEQRLAGSPVEHIVGWAEFCGLRILLEPGVFVPRERTAFLVRHALSLVGSSPVVVDLCCGSGAVGAAVAAAVGDVVLHAVDIDAAAVRCAERNVAGRVYRGDLYDPLPESLRHRVDLIVCNAPYVPSAAIELLPREARLYEPMVALDGGMDGLAVLRRVVEGASRWLAPGGHVVVESSDDQAAAIVGLLHDAGLAATTASEEETEATVVVGSMPK